MGQNPSDGRKKDERDSLLGVASASIAVNAVLLMSVTKPVSSPNGIMNLKKMFIKMLRRFINLHIVNMSQQHHIVRNAQFDLGKLGVSFCRNFQFHLRMLHQNGSICFHLLCGVQFC